MNAKNKILSTPVLGAILAAGLVWTHPVSADEPARLPQNHEYQKVLYDFMATVTEADLTHGVTGNVEVKDGDYDPEYLYRNHIYSMMWQPLIGSKRGAPAITAAPVSFTLPFIEVREEISTVFHNPRNNETRVFSVQPGVYRTHAWAEVLTSFTQWDYPGNPYHKNRALKMRAFMTAASAMMMFHDFAEKNDQKDPAPIRPDWHGYSPVFWAYPYPGFKNVLPAEVQKAYEAGLKIIGERIMSWGIRGETCEHDYIAPVGLLAIARAINDHDFSQAVEDHVRPLYADPRYFHAAGYWDERGGIETGFGGTANWFASWTALFSDWSFVKEALEKVYRLRGHLLLPEPDGTFTGPSHFNSRLGSPVTKDQWAWEGVRDITAAMVTDEAVHLVESLTDAQLREGPAARVARFRSAINENIRIDGHYLTDAEMLAFKMPSLTPWTPRMWMSYNFPASVNPGYEHYRPDAWAHRRELEKAESPLLKPPFLRGDHFVRAFEQDFIVARRPDFGAILHTGPVGTQTPGENKAQFPGPMGLGGGQLSAFWTPATGPVLLGLRAGMSFRQSFDELDAWRTWPNHSINGLTADGVIVSSARNARPEVDYVVGNDGATATVGGPLVAFKIVKDPAADDPEKARNLLYDEPLDGKVGYARKFTVDNAGIRVETTVQPGDGGPLLTELYEVLPVYLGDGPDQIKRANAMIAFQVNGEWTTATDEFTEKVQAIRITRFDGAVVITFDTPCRAKLSTAVWQDTWLNKGAVCRNVLIDLLETGGQPAALKGEKSVAYTIRGL